MNVREANRISINEHLFASFIAMFERNNKSIYIFSFFITSVVPKKIFISMYKSFVRNYQMVPIESLPEEDKRNLVGACRQTGVFFTNTSLTEASMILHTIRFYYANS